MVLITATHRAAGAMAARLLDATGEDDLAERIESLVDSGVIVRSFDGILSELAEVKGHLPPIKLELVIGEEGQDEVAEQFEAEAGALVREALRLHHGGEISTEEVPQSAASAGGGGSGLGELLGQLPQLPLPLAKAVLESVRGVGAMLALLGAGLDRQPLPSWLARALARTWRDGELATLRIIACGDPSVPEDVLPLSERLDVKKMAADTEATNRRLEKLFGQARTSGLAVYPVPHGDDE
ncbi:MAG: hypothetical protein HYY06_07815 [Deltaproteobacteria bacterium]|nr:hypothetical protein [Deltaproteobacteria bacterium]